MSRLESADTIEAKVGAARHERDHFARAVSAEQRVYLLHSKECVRRGDLRKCEFSIALDLGISLGPWEAFQDVAVVVAIDSARGDLEPLRVVAP